MGNGISLVDLALRSSCTQLRFGEWKSILLSPCITSISSTMATLFLSNDRYGWGKRLAAHRIGHLIYLITEPFLCLSNLWMSIYMEHKDLYLFCPFGEGHVLLPQMSFSPIFQSCPKFPSQTCPKFPSQSIG